MDALREQWFLLSEKLVDGIERDIRAGRDAEAFKGLNVLDLIDGVAAEYYREVGWRLLVDGKVPQEGRQVRVEPEQAHELVYQPWAGIQNPLF